MQGVELAHMNATIHAILKAFYDLLDSTVGEALRPIHKYGKSDTLGMDAMPEITIVDQLCAYDRNAVVVTEEIGAQRKIDFTPAMHPKAFRTVFISDPTDRSAQMKAFLKEAQKDRRIADVVRDEDARGKWEKEFSGPAGITGSSSAVTCVRHGVPIFSVVVNYITQQMFISCSAGNFVVDLPIEMVKIDFDFVIKRGKQIVFPEIDGTDMRRFVTFLGKEGYKENLIASNLIEEGDLESTIHYGLPGGPLRILYLSALQAKASKSRVGFILANGEKIGEWIHWLPFVRFAKSARDLGAPALRVFEIYQDRPGTKDGILMATPPMYSIFKPVSETDQRMVIDVNSLANFPNPSRVRATLIVAPHDNRWATRSVNQYGYRPIEFFSED